MQHAPPDDAVKNHEPAAAEGGAASLLDLPEHVLQLVYSHLSVRDRCSMRAACKAGATALLSVQEATLTVTAPEQEEQPQPQPPKAGLFSKLKQRMQRKPRARSTTLDPRPLVGLTQRMAALRRLAPHVASLTLDFKDVECDHDSDQVCRILAACTRLRRLQRLEVRSKYGVEALATQPAPCTDAVCDTHVHLLPSRRGGAETLEAAVRNGWRLKRVRGFSEGCAILSREVWAGVEHAWLTVDFMTRNSFSGEEGQVRLEGLVAALESVPEVEMICSTIYPPMQLLRAATHLLPFGGSDGTYIFDTAEFKAAAASGGLPRLRSLRCCNIKHVAGFPRCMARNLEELHTHVRNGDSSLDQLLAWPPGWLPSLHTLAISLPDDHKGAKCALRAAHAAALAAAAPKLRVLDFNGMQLPAPALAQLCAAHPPCSSAVWRWEVGRQCDGA